MHRREDVKRRPIEQWATPENLGEEFEEFTLKDYAEWYPHLFERHSVETLNLKMLTSSTSCRA